MSEPIKVGDLVYVAYPCSSCGDLSDLGVTFRVGDFWESAQPLDCCGDSSNVVCASAEVRKYPGYPVDTLRRIPPLEELDDVKRGETVNA